MKWGKIQPSAGTSPPVMYLCKILADGVASWGSYT